jgi:rubrerythrin
VDTKLFLSTFALIFLAELGDKTQLTTLAQAAGKQAPWAVFLGASFALVASTTLAVLLGSGLQRAVPLQAIKLLAGVLFLVFGVLTLVSAFRAPSAAVGPASLPDAARGPLASLTIETALAFEDASAERFGRMAQAEPHPELRALWQWLSAEEARHVREVRTMARRETRPAEAVEKDAPRPMLPASATAEAKGRIAAAADHERQMAAFYEALAGLAHLRPMRQALAALAAEERGHAARLERMADSV